MEVAERVCTALLSWFLVVDMGCSLATCGALVVVSFQDLFSELSPCVGAASWEEDASVDFFRHDLLSKGQPKCSGSFWFTFSKGILVHLFKKGVGV